MKITFRLFTFLLCTLAPKISMGESKYKSGCSIFLNVESGVKMGFGAITLYPVVVTLDFDGSDPALMKHENVHCQQVSDQGVISFYSSYLWHYFKNRFKGMDKQMAYAAIPYEIEARKLAEEGL